MKKLYRSSWLLAGAILLNLASMYSANAQSVSPDWAWATSAGNANIDAGTGITVDSQGNTYVTGGFEGTVTFNAGSITLQSAGARDIFVVKYKQQGDVEWAVKAGSSGTDYGRNIAVDGAGNVYVTGEFTGNSIFGTTTLPSNGSSDAFLAKYDAQGALVWVKKVGGSGTDVGRGLAVRQDGTGYLMGDFFNSASFGTFNLSSVGEEDMFILSFDAQGTVEWVNSAGSFGTEIGRNVAIGNSNDIYVTGHFTNTASFGNAMITSNGADDIFLAKYSTTGALLWARGIGGTGLDYGRGITVDNNGNILACGHFHNTVSFDATTLVSGGGFDMYIAKFDAQGNALWAKSAPGANGSHSNHVVVDGSGSSYIAGSFGGTVNFESVVLTSAVAFDGFVTKYDASGNLVWVKNIPGNGGSEAAAIAIDGAGNAHISGNFDGSVNFGASTFTSNGGPDLFVAKIGSVVSAPPHEKALYGGLIIYPNPTAGEFSISLSDLPAQAETITILDAIGRQVYSRKPSPDNTIALHHLPSGVYTVRVMAAEQIFTGLLVIQK